MDNDKYLKKMYADQLTADLGNMRKAYTKEVSTIQREAEKLPSAYADARNQVAATNAMEKRAFDERAAASGLNSGAGGAAQLAMSSAYQGALADLAAKQKAEEAAIRQSQTDLRSDYMAAVEQAKAANGSALNKALYEEKLRADAEAQRRRELEQARADRFALAASKGGGGSKGGSGGGTGGDNPSGITYGSGIPNFDFWLRQVAGGISSAARTGHGMGSVNAMISAQANNATEEQAARIRQMLDSAKQQGLIK